MEPNKAQWLSKYFGYSWELTDTLWLMGIVFVVALEAFFLPVRYVEGAAGETGQYLSRLDQFLALEPNGIGDTLAGIFGPLTLFAAIAALVIQSRELSSQRREFEIMNAQMRTQRLESTFFTLLAGLDRSLKDIDLVDLEGVITTGRDCFRVFYTRLNKLFREYEKKHPPKMALLLAYRSFWNKHQLELSQYFRVLEGLSNYLGQENEVAVENYYHVLRLSLSDQELLLLFYHTHSEYGANLRSFADRALIFEALPTPRLLEYEHHKMGTVRSFGQNPMQSHKDLKSPLEKGNK